MNLTLSPAERTILEALDVSPDLPKIQVRATVVLRAGDGAEDQQIAAELQMPRKDVLHWRKRFEAHGIRGLWDVPGPGPKRRVSPEKERAIVEDALYALSGMNLDARLLALRHRLSRGAVYRVFKKYGIEFDRWGRVKIERLKVFLDPLFGVTVSGIAGLYYGTEGVLALVAPQRPFSELCVSAPSAAVIQVFDDFIAELGKLAAFRKLKLIVAKEGVEENLFLAWLKTIEASRESNSEIHLLTDLPPSRP